MGLMFCSAYTVTFNSYNNSLSVVTKSVILSKLLKPSVKGKSECFRLLLANEFTDEGQKKFENYFGLIAEQYRNVDMFFA